MPTREELKQMQACPLEIKIMLTKSRIREWVREFGDGGVYVSFSGGKDSTVLLHIVREMYPDIEAVFVDTGLEYPEIRKFVNTFDNVTILRPKMRFNEVIKKYGYPIISKVVSEAVFQTRRNIEKGNFDTVRYKQLHGLYLTNDGTRKSLFDKSKYRPLLDVDFPISSLCCDFMKKQPSRQYEKESGKKPILGQMAEESQKRLTGWLNSGCNGFNLKKPQSNPMAFWTEQDVLQYIKKYNIPIAPVYGEVIYAESPEQMRMEEMGIDNCGVDVLKTTGCDRTGCIFCAFGCHLSKVPRFQKLKETHPRQYKYCIEGGEYDECGVWIPNKKGLGMGHVFDELNKIYGDGYIKY